MNQTETSKTSVVLPLRGSSDQSKRTPKPARVITAKQTLIALRWWAGYMMTRLEKGWITPWLQDITENQTNLGK